MLMVKKGVPEQIAIAPDAETRCTMERKGWERDVEGEALQIARCFKRIKDIVDVYTSTRRPEEFDRVQSLCVLETQMYALRLLLAEDDSSAKGMMYLNMGA